MYKNAEEMKVRLEERVYRLERDDEAFLQSIREINTKQASSINQFLISQTGGYGNMGGDKLSLNNIIKKKKILTATNLISEKVVNIERDFIKQTTQF